MGGGVSGLDAPGSLFPMGPTVVAVGVLAKVEPKGDANILLPI